MRVSSAMALLMLTAGPISATQAATSIFETPATFSGNETLIEFDSLNIPTSAYITSAKGVRFALLEQDTLNETGFSPTMSGAPNTTYVREFAPRDGERFLNMINFEALESDLQIRFPKLVHRVAAEIRSPTFGNLVEELHFELYRANLLVGQADVSIRGQGNFFFYGIENDDPFDRWVIRQRMEPTLFVENLRFEAIPEPTTLTLATLSLLALACRRSRSRC